ncbi:MAG: hypothetical protein AAF384_19755 [Pseudomonadota bacterium]
MHGGIIASAIVPHTPRMGVEETAPDFVRPLIEGLREFGNWLRSIEPDCIVLHTTHWVSTFNWYVSAHAEHRGVCVAEEAPDLISGSPYRFPGAPDFASSLASLASARGVPFKLNESEHFRWDYGSYVPLSYIDSAGTIPVVTIPTVILSDLDESMAIGGFVDAVAKQEGKRVAFISSTALTHALVRGPERWPSDERQALDFRFLKLIEENEIDAAIEWFPRYAQESVGEMGGRVVASFLGAARVMSTERCRARRFGEYRQSSGSGNISFALSEHLR